MTTSQRLMLLQLLAIFVALLTIGLKAAAYLLTGSAGLFSDALESCVNLAAAGAASASLWYSSRPADPNHTFGHDKIEFFSSGVEGGLVLIAGFSTAAYAVRQLIKPVPLEALDVGILLAVVASVLNLIVGALLLHFGRKAGSLLSEASGHHLLTDVLSTVGVIIGLVLVQFTGWVVLDGIVALLVSLHIIFTGFQLMRRSFDGLMDHSWTEKEIETFRTEIKRHLPAGTDFHYLKTRRAGRRLFAEFHLLVSGNMTVRESHALSHQLEETLTLAMPGLDLSIHVEPDDEETSWEAEALQRLGESIPSDLPGRESP